MNEIIASTRMETDRWTNATDGASSPYTGP
jgi:hypothetical protein